jgi:poly-gamma-glutamate capsule biosynthesis protein CapA/YwtB (metallophosphatase superfamily)
MRRRDLLLTLGAGLIPVEAAARDRPDKLVLLGQSLIQHDVRGAPWMGLAPVGKLIARGDVAFSDLETAIRGPRGQAPTREGEFLHAAEPVVIDALQGLGVNLLATSNNHAFDLGAGGVLDAIEALDRRGIAHAGTGATLEAASRAGVVRRGGLKTALVAFATGNLKAGAEAKADRAGANVLDVTADGATNPSDLQRILASITAARAAGDLVIAYHHNHRWEKNMADTAPWQRGLARQCLRAGADVFVSHGAPLLQGIEIFERKPIFYDLGNLFFQTVTPAGQYPDDVWRGVVVEARFDKGVFKDTVLTALDLAPQGVGGPTDFATRGLPAVAPAASAAETLALIRRRSDRLGASVKWLDAGRFVAA